MTTGSTATGQQKEPAARDQGPASWFLPWLPTFSRPKPSHFDHDVGSASTLQNMWLAACARGGLDKEELPACAIGLARNRGVTRQFRPGSVATLPTTVPVLWVSENKKRIKRASSR